MNTRWSAIGICSQTELAKAVDLALRSPPHYNDRETGRTHLLTDGLVELWVHPNAKCCVPSFYSSTIIKAKATRWIENDLGCPYCATLCIERLDLKDRLLYPLAVTFGNVALARKLIETNKRIELALSAFVDRAEFWDSEGSYKEENPNTTFGAGWFVPFGPFAAIESVRNNQPRAAFFGTVLQIQNQQNPWTKGFYRHLLLNCADTIYAVVVADNCLSELSVGNFVYVECWFCARYIE